MATLGFRNAAAGALLFTGVAAADIAATSQPANAAPVLVVDTTNPALNEGLIFGLTQSGVFSEYAFFDPSSGFWSNSNPVSVPAGSVYEEVPQPGALAGNPSTPWDTVKIPLAQNAQITFNIDLGQPGGGGDDDIFVLNTDTNTYASGSFTANDPTNVNVSFFNANQPFAYLQLADLTETGLGNATIYDLTETATLRDIDPSPTNTPEPASILLLSAGLGGLTYARRRATRPGTRTGAKAAATAEYV